jgi:branched-subunit amino acid ABC-type transport system permease component
MTELRLLVAALGFGLVTASVLALGAVSLTLQFAVTNYVNFAYGAILTLGAYLCASLTNTAIGFWGAVPITIAVIAAACIVIGIFVDRWFVSRNVPKFTLLLVTFGLALIIEYGIQAIWGPNDEQLNIGVSRAYAIGPLRLTLQQELVIACTAGLVVCLHFVLRYTNLGKKMRAVADSTVLASTSGINYRGVILQTWILTGLMTGVASVVLAVDELTYSPTLGDTIVFLLFASLIAGGLGSPYGTLIGALIIGLFTEEAGVIFPAVYKTDVALIVVIAALLFRPNGIMPAKVRE